MCGFFLKMKRGVPLSSIYEMLYNLITGIRNWDDRSLKSIPTEFYKGFHQFIYHSSLSDVSPPLDIPELIIKLHRPAEEWGIEGVEQHFPLEASLLNKKVGLTFETDDFIEQLQDPKEYEQSKMKELLLYCRDNNFQDEYVKIRRFLSERDHVVISVQDLYMFVGSFQDQQLRDYIRSFYEEVDDLEKYKVCPYCGWTLEKKMDSWVCNRGSTCHLQTEYSMFQKFPKSNLQFLRMTKGIHRYTLLPGMAENKIASKLAGREYTIEMYPDVDDFDILVEKDGKSLALDVKDHYHPFYFASSINDELKYKKIDKDLWFVVPQARLEIFPAYIEQAKQKLPPTVNVISESKLYQRVGEMLK